MRFEKQKSPLMFIFFIVAAAGLGFYTVPVIAPFIKMHRTLAGRITLGLFFFFLLLFCFFGVYYITLYLFYLITRGKTAIKKQRFENPPAVAILYTTKNDFQKEAVLSCINQKYPKFHTFILDDSTDKDFLKAVDEFDRANDSATIIRRPVARGFKAGNLNYGLFNIPSEYEYIAIIDSDEIIPEHFLEDFMSHFPENPNLAFVQAVHRSYEDQKTLFAQDLSLGNDIHWKYLVPPKNKYGFVMFYGHGAVFRRKHLEDIGGFPEIVSEDLAASVLLREKGYYGYTNDRITCYEETPKTYLRYRKRHEKWVRGTAEFVRKFIGKVITARKIPWYEKLDIIMGNLCLFIPVFLLIFLLICGFALPLFVTSSSSLDLALFGRTFTYRYRGIQSQFLDIWTWRLVVPVLLSIIIHYIPVVWEYRKTPAKIFRYLKNSYVVSAGMTIFTFIGFIGGLLSEKTYFAATGDEKDAAVTKTGWLKGYISDRTSSFNMELLFGLFLFASFLYTMNFWLLPTSTSLILSYAVFKLKWDHPSIQRFLFIPFTCMMFILAFVLYITVSR